MKENTAIFTRGLGVRYDLGLNRERTLRRALASFVRSSPRSPDDEFWALRDVDLVVHPGENVGVVGSNGAGKSTLLLALAGVIGADAGVVETFGKRPTLLTLGAGFERELTGRENIRLNGAYLGLSRKQIDRLIDPIIDFSELGMFIDVPLKKYSTGMWSRLGFSIAVHTTPDILLVDEVLSVGDAGFQQKSRLRMLELMEQSRAIIVVSHDVSFIQTTCTKVLWLEKGMVRALGEPELVLEHYLEAIAPPGGGAASAAIVSGL